MTKEERIDCAILDLQTECANYMADLDCWDEAKTKCKTCYIPTALEALEKQIPKETIVITDTSSVSTYMLMRIEYRCPCCNKEIRRIEHHCECGQAILWRE